MKPIPDEMLDAAIRRSVIPVKPAPAPLDLRVWEAVAELKAAEKLREPDMIEAARRRLLETFDEASRESPARALDAMSKAHVKAEVTTRRFTVTRGDDDPKVFTTFWLANAPRRRVTLCIILAIRDLQRWTGRAPTRQAILDRCGETDMKGVSETELSHQLTELGWNDLLP